MATPAKKNLAAPLLAALASSPGKTDEVASPYPKGPKNDFPSPYPKGPKGPPSKKKTPPPRVFVTPAGRRVPYVKGF